MSGAQVAHEWTASEPRVGGPLLVLWISLIFTGWRYADSMLSLTYIDWLRSRVSFSNPTGTAWPSPMQPFFFPTTPTLPFLPMTLILRHHRAALLSALVLSALLTGCSSIDSQNYRHEPHESKADRKARRASHAESFQERRRARTEAEDQRYDAWFNRVMGRPGSS